MSNRVVYMLIGVGLWVGGVLAIHHLGPFFFDAGVKHVLWFALNFAVGALTILAVAKLTGVSRHAMVIPSLVIAMVAMLLDGIVVTLDAAGYTSIYADTPLGAAYAGGTLLFAFWSALFFALLWHRPEAAAQEMSRQ